ncbi:MAG: hypothetical protein EA353_08085 [Puniceicoccaceae bacterium]|nr:MAG: hypothetical protein EA353_08085 [Puniceicoccaceae bacterium]
MLVSYTQETTLRSAVADTFSGQRPCDLCQMIEAVSQEKEGQTLGQRAADDFRLLIPRLERILVATPPRETFEHPGHFARPESAVASTPAPPPKALI